MPTNLPSQLALPLAAPPEQLLRLGVLVSGRGTNLAALLAACAAGALPATVALVISNHSHAGALEVAAAHDTSALAIPRAGYLTRAAQQAAMVEALDAAGVGLVVCAGYDRIFTTA